MYPKERKQPAQKKCPICKKIVHARGLTSHIRIAHNEQNTDRQEIRNEIKSIFQETKINLTLEIFKSLFVYYDQLSIENDKYKEIDLNFLVDQCSILANRIINNASNKNEKPDNKAGFTENVNFSLSKN